MHPLLGGIAVDVDLDAAVSLHHSAPCRRRLWVSAGRSAEIAGWIIGWHLGAKYLTPSMEQPVWGGAVGDTPVSITVIRYQGKLYYRLYVVEDGESAVVAQGD